MGLAQQVAYSSLLAFFPAVIALIGLLDLINAYDPLQSFLDPVAPKAVTQLIDSFKQDSGGSGSVFALLFGSALAIWAASGAMGSVVKAVNRTYDRLETRPYWKVKLISIILVLVSALVTGAMLLLVVLGGTLGDALSQQTHLGGFTWVWNILRWPIAFGAVLVLFALIYYLAPNTDERSWRWVTAGSIAGALAWVTLSGLFALYTSFSNSYTKTYGALAAGIILLLWLNYSAWAVLFGAELNAQLDRQVDIHDAGGEHAGLIKPVRRTR